MKKKKLTDVIVLKKKKRKRPSNRSCWVMPELLNPNHGTFWEITVPYYSDERFYRVFRMKREVFQKLCQSLRTYLQKRDTKFRKAITLGKRVAICIYVLKGGCDHGTVADLFGVGHSTVRYLVSEFCDAVIMQHKKLVHFPYKEEEKEAIATDFFEKCQYPDCFGALDGTHIPILPPDKNKEDYFCYKGFHSISVLALVDANYLFRFFVSGAPGRCNDPSILERSSFFQMFEGGLNGEAVHTKFHIIADGIFALKTWLMKPYEFIKDMPLIHQNFNYRLSRARVKVENAFGRLKGRFRILLRKPDVHIETMRKIIETCMILHNFLELNGEEVLEKWLEEAREEEQALLQEAAQLAGEKSDVEPDENFDHEFNEEQNPDQDSAYDGSDHESLNDEQPTSNYANAKRKRAEIARKLFLDEISID